MSDLSTSSWKTLISKIGNSKANEELDRRCNTIFATIRDIASVCTSQVALTARIKDLKDVWDPVCDQYERTVLHLAKKQKIGCESKCERWD